MALMLGQVFQGSNSLVNIALEQLRKAQSLLKYADVTSQMLQCVL
jgi:hypothetical protein